MASCFWSMSSIFLSKTASASFWSMSSIFLTKTASASEHPQVGDGAGAVGPVTAATPFSRQEATIILSSTVLTFGAWHGERRDLCQRGTHPRKDDARVHGG